MQFNEYQQLAERTARKEIIHPKRGLLTSVWE